MIAVHHVQVSIPIGAEDAARDFYCGIMGMVEVPKPASLAGRGGFWLQLGDVQVHFGTEDGVERGKTKGHVAYQVTGLEGWRTKLKQAGCDVRTGIPIPGYDRFEFRDPFGNRVEFLEEIGE